MMHLCLVNFITPPQIGERSIAMTVSGCLSTSISLEVHVQSLHNFLCLLGLWQRSDTSCTSGCIDDVILVHKPVQLNVVTQLKKSLYAALGLAINGT